MTLVLLLGYIPLTFLLLAVGLLASARRNDSESARVLGDRVGRRTGVDRRGAVGMPFVGADRRTGADRRGVVGAADERERAA